MCPRGRNGSRSGTSSGIHEIEKKGIRVTPDHLKLSKRATISMPWHKVQDELEENRWQNRQRLWLYPPWNRLRLQ